jgi:hypothetical protein
VRAALAILRQAPAAFTGVAAVPGALRPLAVLAAALFEDVTERRFRSYEVLEQLMRGPAAPGPREG